MDTDSWQHRIREMSQARSWTGYHSPKNLAMALSVEVAELVEIFQWLDAAESAQAMEDPERARAVRDEVADVMTYLLRLADVLDIDLERAMSEKVAESEERYPVGSLPSGLEGAKGDPPRLEVSKVVLGVARCAEGWVGTVLEPGTPRPRVVVAQALDALVETVRESAALELVGVDETGGRELEAAVDELRREHPGVAVRVVRPGPGLTAAVPRPSVTEGSGYGPDDVDAALAAACALLDPATR